MAIQAQGTAEQQAVRTTSGKEGTGVALQLNMTGEALEVTPHLSAKKLKDKRRARRLLTALDEEYRGMEEDRLENGESMSGYIRRLKQARRELEEEEEEMNISDKFFAWLLMQKGSLSSEEKSRARGAAHCSEHESFCLEETVPLPCCAATQ